MKLQLTCDESIDQKTQDFLTSKGEMWDVLPGVPMLEIEVKDLDDLNKLIYDTQEEFNKNNNTMASIGFDLSPMEIKFEEDEPMYYVVIGKRMHI